MRTLLTLLALAPAPVQTSEPGATAEAFTAEAFEVSFEGSGGFELAGELLLPPREAGATLPAMLLLPGSGPTDRDGNQLPLLETDLLKQIAERLAEAGVATLRFDKRAVARYADRWPAETDEIDALFAFEHFVGDARAALRVLREREEIDAERVGIIGHSEGGLIALALGKELAGTPHAPKTLVLLATAGRTLDVVLREQIARQLGGADSPLAKRYLPALDAAIAAVKAGEPVPDDLPPGLAPLFAPTALSIVRSYFTIDPADLARAAGGDVLVLQGAEDVQVSAERDAPRLVEALEARASGEERLVIVPDTSHNLKRVESAKEPGFAGPVVAEALDAIATWARERLDVGE